MPVKVGFVLDVTELDNLVPSKADMGTIGVLMVAPNKDPSLEYNRPYAINTDNVDFYTKLGDGGSGRYAMLAISKQLGQMRKAARLVAVLIDEGANIAETLANAAGSAVLKTGIHAFRKAGQMVNRIPRICIAPGLTSQFTVGAVLSLAIGAAGTGYAVNDAIAATGGGGSGFTAKVSSIGVGGSITGIEILTRGSSYETVPSGFPITTSGGSGATLTGTVGNLANPVIAEFPSLLEGIIAVAPVAGPSTDRQAALDWRELFASKRLIPTDGDVIILDEEGDEITIPNDGIVAGLINRTDELHGGLPFHVAGNREVYGVLGPSRTIDFSLTDDSTEGQELLTADIGIITRGEGGDDFSIAEGGTVYVGMSTASNENIWQYYNQVRGRDWLHITALKTLRELLLKHNLTNRTIQVFVNTLRGILNRLVADELIHATFEVALIPSLNSPQDLREGQLTIKMAVEEPAPFTRGVIKSTRHEFALEVFVNQLAAQINQGAI